MGTGVTDPGYRALPDTRYYEAIMANGYENGQVIGK